MRQVQTLAVLMFACRLRSLRGLDRVTNDARFRDNGCVFSRARRDTVICSHQMTNVLAAMDCEEIAALRTRLIKTLHRQKQLPDALLLGHLMMVSDGTGIFSSTQYHCARCLTQDHKDGTTIYLHNVLEAKVITWNGLVHDFINTVTQETIPAAVQGRLLRSRPTATGIPFYTSPYL
jgi:hypothetical protein